MDTGPSRKRLRRSTRSCYQCRRRKVKCQLTDENVETCAECVKSGTRCTLQPPETELGSGNSPVQVDKQEDGSRLDRIESLLKKLVETLEQSRPAEPTTIPAPGWDDSLLHLIAHETLPPNDFATSQPPRMQDAKQSLVALLPSAQDAVTIISNTTAWLWGAENPPGSILNANDSIQLLDIAAITRGSAMHIAKTLLLFALYMQQLPANFDTQFLESQSVERSIELIVERVKLFMVSHEDEFCSMDGIECLTLLSLLQLNDGAIRKAWMTFRRILDIARLEGLPDSFSLSARSSSCSDIGLRRRLWLSTVNGDCYCSLLLGLEPGLGIAPFGPDEEWNDPLAEDNANIQRRICLIAARVAQRNAVGLHQDRHTLQEIDEALNGLQDLMPHSWWRPPSFRQDRPLHSGNEPNRLICQLWFFQTRIFAHLPIAFGDNTSDSLKSLESCLEASRITLHRYLGLQRARDHFSRCRSVDQVAFLAAVVLLLGKVQLRHDETPSTSFSYDSDQALLEQTINSFEAVGKTGSREQVSRQSFEILSTMLELSAADSNGALFSRSLPSSDYNSTSAAGIRFNSEVAFGGAPSTTKSGMEDIIVSSIQPVLDTQSLASRLIDMLFASKQSMEGTPKCNQGLSKTHAAFALGDLVDQVTP
ncbi:hypothetical protein F5Y13DRAFT_148199 [Hypoxylon sp. FL1857]|nr:hypothetical protein F5Y13DRAFT_148199 [Hypoxylon sp. FL1857]